MLGAILILMLMPILDLGRTRGVEHRPLTRFFLVTLAGSFIILLVLGGHHVENPFIVLGQIVSVYYFGFFFIILPIISIIENSLLDLSIYFSPIVSIGGKIGINISNNINRGIHTESENKINRKEDEISNINDLTI
jgi:Cytochrome b(C-terminal)/b6/petD